MREEMPRGVTAVLLLAAAASCLFGILRGETAAIFIKAVNICMECIGLG